MENQLPSLANGSRQGPAMKAAPDAVESALMADILNEQDHFLNNVSRLRQADPNDQYWRDLSDPERCSRDGRFLETGMLIGWIGRTFKPKRILEIGTRTGGSLISLLSQYSGEEQERVDGIVSFDMWREYVSTTALSSLASKLMGRDRNINLSERFTGMFKSSIADLATDKVQDNLRLFGIRTDRLAFISGDSKESVPTFFTENPNRMFDYILVDGGHDQETAFADLCNVVDHCDVGGVIVFDDIGPESYRLLPVWDRFRAAHWDEFDFHSILHRKGMAWAVRKRFKDPSAFISPARSSLRRGEALCMGKSAKSRSMQRRKSHLRTGSLGRSNARENPGTSTMRWMVISLLGLSLLCSCVVSGPLFARSPNGKVEQIVATERGCSCWVKWKPKVDGSINEVWVACPCTTNVGDSVLTQFCH